MLIVLVLSDNIRNTKELGTVYDGSSFQAGADEDEASMDWRAPLCKPGRTFHLHVRWWNELTSEQTQ